MVDDPLGQAVYLDTNFFIKAVEGTAKDSTPPKKLLEVLRTRLGVAVTSEITFAELLAPSKETDALKLPDAIHLVSAIRSKCRYFVSGDSDFDKLPEGMTLMKPDEQGIQSLLNILA